MAKVLGAVSAARHVHLLAEHYGVCVVLHTDHANKKLIPWVEGMLDHGEAYFKETGKPLFSSHMLDLSEEPIDWNLNECARMLKRMAPMDMSLEIELGVTGGEEDGVGGEFDESADNSKLYTQPEDVLQAYETLNSIGHFSVAASFGNVHGVYKPGNVKLRPEILKNSQDAGGGAGTSTGHEPAAPGVPRRLGLREGQDHRGRQLRRVQDEHRHRHPVRLLRGRRQIRRASTRRPSSTRSTRTTARRYKKFYDPRKWLRAAEVGMVERLTEACADLNSTGKSLAQG